MRRPFEVDPSALRDFHPVQTPLAALAQTLPQNYPPLHGAPCSRETFLALLCGIAALRKTPGIPGPSEAGSDVFTTLPQCAGEAQAAACRAHLKIGRTTPSVWCAAHSTGISATGPTTPKWNRTRRSG